jgi:hypothetical protein
MLKSNGKKKYYLKSNDKNDSTNYSTHRSRTMNKTSQKNFKMKNPIEIEKAIHEMTKNIEQNKIDIRILKERLEQRKRNYNQLQGKPITNLTSEEKERALEKRRKEISNRKYNDPVKRKVGREREIIDARIKMQKENKKNEAQFERLGNEIDDLTESNKALKKEINDLRKRKEELEKLKEKIIKENKEREEELNDILLGNADMQKSVRNNKYKATVKKGVEQEKEFMSQRDELEKEYQKVIQQYILRERQKLKENEFKKKVAEVRNGKSNKTKKNEEIQKELKRIEDEKMLDRTPILNELLQKWRELNKEKKDSLNRYVANCTKIRQLFEDLAIQLDLTTISDLPEVYRKTEERLSNINFHIKDLENENVRLENEKDTLSKQIELLSTKRKGLSAYRKKFIEQKKLRIRVFERITNNLRKDIRTKEKFIKNLKPETDSFLSKLNETFLSEFIINKMNVDPNTRYNYKNISNYLANVEDYLNLIYQWKDNNSTDNFNLTEQKNMDNLREEMKQKLENFETNRVLNNSLYSSMKTERKNGTGLSQIIKKTSNDILGQMKNNKNKTNTSGFNKTKNNKSGGISKETKADENNRYGNYSQANQQSSLYYPNNSSYAKK